MFSIESVSPVPTGTVIPGTLLESFVSTTVGTAFSAGIFGWVLRKFDCSAQFRRAFWFMFTVRTLYSLLSHDFLWETDQLRVLRSRILTWFMRKPRLTPETVRNSFNDTPNISIRPVADHTHPLAAADRNSAAKTVELVATNLGLKPYFYQCSRADERNSRSGSRAHFWAKDLTAKPQPYDPPSNPLIAMVDVDQYVDMPSFLCDTPQPTLLYTFQPTAVARIGENYSFTFDGDDFVDYHVGGGGHFSHQVWNYGSDHFRVAKRFFGIPYASAAFMVDRKYTSPDHELIMLTPIGSWGIFGTWICHNWISGTELKRLRLADEKKEFLRLQVATKTGLSVSLAKVGSHAVATIPKDVNDTISNIATTSKYDLTMPQVASLVDNDKRSAAVLVAYHRGRTESKIHVDTVCPVDQAVRSYQFDPHNFDPAAKPAMVAFMSPLINDAFIPAMTKPNEEECIRGRIVDVRPPILPMTPLLQTIIDEFIKKLIPDSDVGKLHPTDYDEVLDRQPRPTQRRNLAMGEAAAPKRDIQTFIKREAYGGIKDPRPISVINSVDKRDYSMFIYAVEQIIKKQPWYAFAKQPVEIASIVSAILEKALSAANSDFGRFDGHGSNIMRALELAFLLRAFHPDHHQRIIDLHRSQYNLQGFATLGSWYESAFARASGSPETALFNTLVNAFVAFLSFRITRQGSVHIKADEAWSKLGIYGGDDGLTPDVDAKSYKRAAGMIGQELDVQIIQRGEMGIKFLARVYSPNVWFGDVNSVCDLPRQLSKLHVTVRLNAHVTPIDKLLEKCRSYYLTDANTPILGPFCAKAMELYGGEIKEDDKTLPMRAWSSFVPKPVQYPNEYGTWMDAYAESALPDYDLKKYTTWLDSVTSLSDMLRAPMCQAPTPPTSKKPVVVDDQVLPMVGPITPPPPLPAREVKRSKAPKGNWRARPMALNAPPAPPPSVNPGAAAALEIVEDRKHTRPQSTGTPPQRTIVQPPRRETFEELRARKIRLGTFVERPTFAARGNSGRGKRR